MYHFVVMSQVFLCRELAIDLQYMYPSESSMDRFLFRPVHFVSVELSKDHRDGTEYPYSVVPCEFRQHPVWKIM